MDGEEKPVNPLEGGQGLEGQELQNLQDKVANLMAKEEFPSCDYPVGSENGPCYCHLGHAASFDQLREQTLARFGCTLAEARFVQVTSIELEGMTCEQCSLAKWILRRTPVNEKYLVVYKQRPGHFCQYAVTGVTSIFNSL